MELKEIIELIVVAVVALTVAIYYIVQGIKNKWFSKVIDTVKLAVKEAEGLYPGSGTGENKKNYVIKKVQDKCTELGIPYEFIWKLISKCIDKIVEGYNTIAK